MSSSDIESTGVKNPSTHLFTPTSFRSPEGDLQTPCPQQAASHQDTEQGWPPNPEPESRTWKKPLRKVCSPAPRGGIGEDPFIPVHLPSRASAHHLDTTTSFWHESPLILCHYSSGQVLRSSITVRSEFAKSILRGGIPTVRVFEGQCDELAGHHEHEKHPKARGQQKPLVVHVVKRQPFSDSSWKTQAK